MRVGRGKTLASQILAVMERAFRAGHELALLDAIVFCHETQRPLPNWAMEELARRSRRQARGEKPKSKLGRHAPPWKEQEQLEADAHCFELVKEMREKCVKRFRGEDAFSKAAEKLHLDRETVRKAYYRTREKLATGSYYVSLLYLQDPVGYLQHNSIL